MSAKNEPHRTEFVEKIKLDVIAEQLETWADQLRKASKAIEQQGKEGLAAYYWNSAEIGIARLGTFMKSVEDSRLALTLGKPVDVGQLKPRSTAKRKSMLEQRAENKAKGVEGVPVKEISKKLAKKSSKKSP